MTVLVFQLEREKEEHMRPCLKLEASPEPEVKPEAKQDQSPEDVKEGIIFPPVPHEQEASSSDEVEDQPATADESQPDDDNSRSAISSGKFGEHFPTSICEISVFRRAGIPHLLK